MGGEIGRQGGVWRGQSGRGLAQREEGKEPQEKGEKRAQHVSRDTIRMRASKERHATDAIQGTVAVAVAVAVGLTGGKRAAGGDGTAGGWADGRQADGRQADGKGACAQGWAHPRIHPRRILASIRLEHHPRAPRPSIHRHRVTGEPTDGAHSTATWRAVPRKRASRPTQPSASTTASSTVPVDPNGCKSKCCQNRKFDRTF